MKETKKETSQYMTRFSTCAHVFNVLDNKEPVYSMCPYGSKGHVNQSPDRKCMPEEKCTQCGHYKYREHNIETIPKEKIKEVVDATLQRDIKNKRVVLNDNGGVSHLYMEVMSNVESENRYKSNMKEQVINKSKKSSEKSKGYLEIL